MDTLPFKLPFNLAEHVFKPTELKRAKHFKIYIGVWEREVAIFILNPGSIFHNILWGTPLFLKSSLVIRTSLGKNTLIIYGTLHTRVQTHLYIVYIYAHMYIFCTYMYMHTDICIYVLCIYVHTYMFVHMYVCRVFKKIFAIYLLYNLKM